MEPGMDCEFVDLIDQISANISRLNSAEGEVFRKIM